MKGSVRFHQSFRCSWFLMPHLFSRIAEYLSEEMYEEIGSPAIPHAPGAKATRKDRFCAVLTDPAQKSLVASIHQFESGTPAKLASRLVGIYGILSSHIHGNYTPSEWQSSGDKLRIVEGPLTNRDCRVLEAICKHLSIPAEVHRLLRSSSEGQCAFSARRKI